MFKVIYQIQGHLMHTQVNIYQIQGHLMYIHQSQGHVHIQ
jgi:hypothetical protein